MGNLAAIARELFGWVSLLVTLAGLAVSLFAFGRTRWALVLAAGFGLESVLNLFYRVLTPLLARGFGAGSYEGVFVVTSLLSAVAMAAIVGGVAGVLSDLKRQA